MLSVPGLHRRRRKTNGAGTRGPRRTEVATCPHTHTGGVTERTMPWTRPSTSGKFRRRKWRTSSAVGSWIKAMSAVRTLEQGGLGGLRWQRTRTHAHTHTHTRGACCRKGVLRSRHTTHTHDTHTRQTQGTRDVRTRQIAMRLPTRCNRTSGPRLVFASLQTTSDNFRELQKTMGDSQKIYEDSGGSPL